MDAIQSIGSGQSMAGQNVSPTSAATGGAAARGAVTAGAMAQSTLSVSMESRVEMFIAQSGGADRLDQLLRALILLLILLQMLGDKSEEQAPAMLQLLGEQFASGGRTQMAAASYQAVSLVQTSSVQVSAGALALGQASAAGSGGGQQLDVVA